MTSNKPTITKVNTTMHFVAICNYKSTKPITWKKTMYAKRRDFALKDDGTQIDNKDITGASCQYKFSKSEEGKYVKLYAFIDKYENLCQSKIFYVEPQHETAIRIKPESVKADKQEVTVGETVKCSVGYHNPKKQKDIPEKDVPQPTKDNVKWKVKIDGKTERLIIDDEVIMGTLSFNVPEEWAGKEVVLMPYLSPLDINVAVKMNVKPMPETNELRRKVFFIHGTISDNRRWENFPETRRVLNIIGFDPPKDERDSFMTSDWEEKNCVYSFSWKDLATQFNNVVDRAKASNDLVAHIETCARDSPFQEIVLVGHSHGGNVAIQAADRLAEKFDKVYIITIATPAQNRENFASGGHSVVPGLAKFEKIDGFQYFKNPENPVNWKNRHKIRHYALWNDKDHVDTAAQVLDHVAKYYGMTDNGNYFTNAGTVNIKFSIDVKENIESDRVFVAWLLKLNALYKTLYQYCADGYILPELPPLRTFPEYQSGTKEKLYQKNSVYVAEADATYVAKPVMRPINTVTTSQLLRTGDFDRLFKDSRKYTEFLNDIDRFPRRVPPGKLNDAEEYDPRVLQLYASGFNRIAAMFTESNIARYYCSMIRTGSYPEHGFDLATPGEIQQAINDGRIKPFERTKRTQKD